MKLPRLLEFAGVKRCVRQMTTVCGAFWVNSSVLLPESERRPGESRAEGTAFTLLQEGDAHVSGALEHSGGAAAAAAAAAELLLRCGTEPTSTVRHMYAARGGAASAGRRLLTSIRNGRQFAVMLINDLGFKGFCFGVGISQRRAQKPQLSCCGATQKKAWTVL